MANAGVFKIGYNKSRTLINVLLYTYLLYILGRSLILAWHQINGGYAEYHHPYLQFGISIVAFLLFAFGLTTSLKKLIKTKPPLILSNEGLTDSRLWGIKFISWADITEVQMISTGFFQKLILLKLKEPEEYLQKVTNPVVLFFMRRNVKKYGSLLFITAMGLECSVEELKSRIENKWKEYNMK